jgi:EEF1A lysine methyltransferase 2
VVDWVSENVPPGSNPAMLEIGCGNGTLLFGLHEAGYSGERLAGIDYSTDAVSLSKSISATRNAESIAFSVCDFLNDVPSQLGSMDGPNSWDVLLDKGTYDAIALGVKNEQGKSPAVKYPACAARLLKPGGFLLITCTFSLLLHF